MWSVYPADSKKNLTKKVNRRTVCIYKRERLKVNTEFARKNAATSCLESKHEKSKA